MIFLNLAKVNENQGDKVKNKQSVHFCVHKGEILYEKKNDGSSSHWTTDDSRVCFNWLRFWPEMSWKR